MSQAELIPQVVGGYIPFIPVYPGNKSKSTYRSWIFGKRFQWGAVLEPFCGTGATSLYARCDRRFIGEAAPDVWSIWQCWLDGNWDAVQWEIQEYRKMAPDVAWHRATWVYEKPDPHIETLGRCRIELAAASLVIRKLAFGGVVRHNKAGQLNVTWSSHKLSAFHNWQAPAPAPFPGWKLTKDWRDAVEWWQEADIADSLILLDPPYYLPYAPGTERGGTGLMTPAYRGHQPHSEECLALTLDPLRMVATNPNAKRIVVCNYFSPRLQIEIEAIAHATGRMLSHHDFGAMNQMNRGHGQPKVKAIERFWILE